MDRRGLNDSYIARLPLGERSIIAHEHDAPFQYLKDRKVVLFDALNQIVHKKYKPKYFRRRQLHEGQALEMRAVKFNEHYLLFATFVDILGI